jgi:hypothetical protein
MATKTTKPTSPINGVYQSRFPSSEKLPWRKAPGCFIAIKDIY